MGAFVAEGGTPSSSPTRPSSALSCHLLPPSLFCSICKLFSRRKHRNGGSLDSGPLRTCEFCGVCGTESPGGSSPCQEGGWSCMGCLRVSLKVALVPPGPERSFQVPVRFLFPTAPDAACPTPSLSPVLTTAVTSSVSSPHATREAPRN